MLVIWGLLLEQPGWWLGSTLRAFVIVFYLPAYFGCFPLVLYWRLSPGRHTAVMYSYTFGPGSYFMQVSDVDTKSLMSQKEIIQVTGRVSQTLGQLEGRVLGDDLIINLYWGFPLRGLARQGMTP